jgi:hypothetical protein
LRLAALFAGTALAPAAAGCGGGTSANAERTPTKAAFIKTADAICAKTDGQQKEAQIAFQKKHPEANSSRLWEEKIVLEAGLPPVREEARDLSGFTAPSGDEATVKAITGGMEVAVKESESNPSLLLKKGDSGPFTEVMRLAHEYGFKACAIPL